MHLHSYSDRHWLPSRPRRFAFRRTSTAAWEPPGWGDSCVRKLSFSVPADSGSLQMECSIGTRSLLCLRNVSCWLLFQNLDLAHIEDERVDLSIRPDL